MDQILAFLSSSPPLLIYVVLGIGAAVENIIPPIPADTFILIGGFLAARGYASASTVFLVTWSANVSSALAVFAAGYRYGDTFFQTRLGRYLLAPQQLETVRRFYRRWGSAAIFYTRFLPGVRAVVPVFAGLTHQKPWLVATLLLVASGIWYGGLTWAGVLAGRNLDRILVLQSRVNTLLAGIAVLVSLLVAWWWIRSRRPSMKGRNPDGSDSETDEGAE